jgi:hypothetical protein
MQDVGEGHFGAVEDAHFGWRSLRSLSLGVVVVEFQCVGVGGGLS